MANRLNVSVRLPINWPRLRHVFLVVALLASASCAGLSQRYYSAEPIEAWVVDEKTGKPLEGVIVVAHWKLMRGTVAGRVPAGTMMLLETVTDANGRFSFPAWGPLQNTSDGFLDHEDPMLIFFKPEYRPITLGNHWGAKAEEKPSKRRSEWSGKVIRIPLFVGTTKEYAEHIASFSNSQSSSIGGLSWVEGCGFRRTPMMANALDEENTVMKSRGFRFGGFTYDSFLPEATAKCGLKVPDRK